MSHKKQGDVFVNLGTVDWDLLCRQKLQLLEIIDVALERDPKSELLGLVHLIDHIQDQAEAQGYGVVYMEDDDEGDEV